MPTRCIHTLALLALVALLTGCAVYPVVQAAGAAMTGYDAVHLADNNIPRRAVMNNQTAGNDSVLQRRLREKLLMDGLHSVSAHVIGSQAYLVGRLSDRSRANLAVQSASKVRGLTVIHCKFFPAPVTETARADFRTLNNLRKKLNGNQRLDGAPIYTDVISGNAVLVGTTRTRDQKHAVLLTASNTRGVLKVVDYVVVANRPETASLP